MKILLTNDDGFSAPGLGVIAKVLRDFGDLTVVAPKHQQSATSMAVSMGLRPIAAKQLPAPENAGPNERWYYIDATPASCVKYAIDMVYYPEKPDVVVSGINHGSNAASAVLYSGTVGAALEGAVNGIKSIAISLDSNRIDADFSAAEVFLHDIIDKLINATEYKSGVAYNVNIPYRPINEIKGVRIAYQGLNHWEKEFIKYEPKGISAFLEKLGIKEFTFKEPELEEGEEAYMMTGILTDNIENTDKADHRLLREGYITITPQKVDSTDYSHKDYLVSLEFDKDFK